jgi:dTDP-4-dehydrorhamnose reductase
MLKLSESKTELKVVSDQHGVPTSCVDLSFALGEIIDHIEDRDYAGNIFHLSNSYLLDSKNELLTTKHGICWADFAREIFSIAGKDIQVIDCSSSEYPTKAQRPSFSILKNESEILLPNWRD